MLVLMLVLNLIIEIDKFVSGVNILAINTLLSPSHHIFNDVYLLELAKRGHNVTLLGHDKDKHNHPNYTHIIMEGVYDKLKENFDVMEMKNFNTWETINALWSFAEITCILDYQTEGLKTIMQYPDGFKFDLIVWDFNVGHCLFPLIEKFGRPPVIAVNPFINQPNILRNIWQSFIPFMAHPHTDHMTLWQKLKSNFFSVVTEITRIIHYIPRQTELAESYFGKVNLTIQEVETNVSLMLANYNPVFNYVEALPPNIIPVGGLHIQSKPLPVDLKNVLDDSKFGVILFSLGSNVQSKELGEEKIQAIIKCFSRINQTVIWKFENNNLTNLPKNIHIRRWVPQNDILGHPNTVLFITHGGLLSSHEIIYNGVPVIGIPFFLDQFQNVENFIAKGIGEKVEFNEITENILCNTIQKVLHDKSYSDKVKKLSVLYKHRQNTPLETAMFWTEYILKHKSAAHLNLATRDMNFLELFNLDIAIICLFPIFLFSVIIYTCIILCIFKYKNQNKTTAKTKIS